MQCVILAGGLATRIRPMTDEIPKSMVKFLNKPFLEYQINILRKNGIAELILCVGYLYEQIENYFENGSRFGVNIRYSYEKERLLGTGGAIKKAKNLLNKEFFILYGDSYLDTDYQKIYKYFKEIDYPAIMTVYKNENKLDRSNLIFKDGIIELYDKENKIPEMEYIDYGLSIVSKEVLEEIPENIPYDLAKLYKKLSQEKRLAGFEVSHRFYEIGSLHGLKEFENFVRKGGTEL